MINPIANIKQGLILSANEHKNLHFNNEQNIHMCSKNYEESGYGLDLDALTSCTNHGIHILGEMP